MNEKLQEIARIVKEQCASHKDCSGCIFYSDGCIIYGEPSEWRLEDI